MAVRWHIKATVSLIEPDGSLPKLNQETAQELSDAIVEAASKIVRRHAIKGSTVNVDGAFRNI